jgi:hypothetical protein
VKYSINILVTAIACLVTYGICSLVSSYSIGFFIVKCAICLLVPNIVIYCCYSLTNEFQETKLWLKPKIRGILKHGKEK